MDFTLGHLEFKKFRKRAEEIFLCAFSRPLQGLSSKGALFVKDQICWTEPVNLGGERGTL